MRSLLSRSWLNLHDLFKYSLLGLWLFVICTPSYASTVGNLPFNAPLDEFKAGFISGCFDIAIILLMGSCLMMATREWGDGIKQILNMVFFLSLALGAPTGVALLFGTGATF